MEIAGKSFLVTGGAGFIGSHIVDLLLREGASRIVILDNMTRGLTRNLEEAYAKTKDQAGRLTLIHGDIRLPYEVEQAVKGCDGVFHQAALRITQCATDNRAAVDCLVTGTFNVLEAAAAAGVKKVCSASSASVYGLADIFPTKEDHHPYNNRTLYGACKIAGEQMLRSFYEMKGLDYMTLRPFNVYGPRMDAFGKYTEVLIRWMERINAGQPPIVFGDGAQTMDFVYAPEVARAYVLAMKSDLSDRVYNVGSGKEISLLELLETLLEVMNRPHLKPEFRPERAVNPVQRRLADISAIGRDIGWRPEVSLKEGLGRLVEWHKGLERKGEQS